MRYVAKEVNGKGYVFDNQFSDNAPISVEKTIAIAIEACIEFNREHMFEIAESMAEEALCNKGCLCPKTKEAGFCSSCDVFYSLSDYYLGLLDEENEEEMQAMIDLQRRKEKSK